MTSSPGADGYEVVPYTPDRRSDVLRLRETFRGISRAWNAEHFRWQQEENPWFEGHLIRLALHRDEVVGLRILHAAQWEVAGGATEPPLRFRAPCYAGTVIAPGHRSRGLLSRLSRAVEDDLARRGVRFALNLNAGPVTHVNALAEGWRALGPFGQLRRECPVRESGLPRRLVRPLRRIATAATGRGVSGVQLSRAPRPGPMAELVSRRAAAGRIRHVRDEAWFRWRFRDPSSRYLFGYVERGGGLAAYLVFHRAARPLPGGPLRLVDWERRHDLDWSELLGAAVRVADHVALPLVTWRAAFPERARTALAELGFEPDPLAGPLAAARPTFLVGRIPPRAPSPDTAGSDWIVGGARIDDVRSWDLRPLYADAY